jgi:hypothetical protein
MSLSQLCSQSSTEFHTMNEPPIVRELHKAIAVLREKTAAQARQIEELRGAVVALMEPDMPRILRTPGGIMVLEQK